MSIPMRQSTSQSQSQSQNSSTLHKRLPSATSTPTFNNSSSASSFHAATTTSSSRPSTPATATILPPMTSTPKSHAMAKTMSAGTKSFGSPAAASQASPLTNHSGRSPAVSSSLQHAAVTTAAAGRSASAAAAASASTPTPAGAANAPSTGHTHPSINFDSPSGLSGIMQGLEGGAGMSLSLSNLGLNMGLSASGGAPIGSAMGRAQDDAERRRRLEIVLDGLKKRPGRVSREALERLGRRCEMDVVPEGPDKLSLGGRNSVVLDVEFAPDQPSIVDRVALSFPSASDAMSDHLAKASRILHRDLTPPAGVAAINATLDRFADNLERLATLDKLSTPGADCFEAIIGVYTSLRRLYEHERSTAEQFFGAKGGGDDVSHVKEAAQMEVMCRKNGKPEMHAKRRVGLSLQYWCDRHLVPPSVSPKTTGDEMEVDGPDTGQASPQDEQDDEDEKTVYSLTIECEPSPPALYPPMRVSSDWLSTSVVRSAAANGFTAEPGPGNGGSSSETSKEGEELVVDWQEPDDAVLPKREPIDSSDGAAAPVQVQSRFVARFEPALVLPVQVAMQLYNSFGVHWPPDSLSASSAGPFDQLVLGPALDAEAEALDNMSAATLLRPHQYRSFRKTFTSFSTTTTATATATATDTSIGEDERQKQQGQECTYEMGLYTPRVADVSLSIAVETLPFAHPRQLIEALPIFRQYAFAASLLKRSFAWTSISVSSSSSSVNNGQKPSVENDDGGGFLGTAEEELDRLLGGAVGRHHPTQSKQASSSSSKSTSKSSSVPRKVDVLFNLHSIITSSNSQNKASLSSTAANNNGNNNAAGAEQQGQQQQQQVQPHFTVMRGSRKALVNIGLNAKIEMPFQNVLVLESSNGTTTTAGGSDDRMDVNATTTTTTATATADSSSLSSAMQIDNNNNNNTIATAENASTGAGDGNNNDNNNNNNISSSTATTTTTPTEKLVRALEIAEDFAIWSEWISSLTS